MEIFNEPVVTGTLSFIIWFAVSYLYHGLGITLGYHRILTHKSLKVPSWLMYLVVSGGYLCFMGAPINWVAVHRLHHQKSDQDGDPHSPRDGFQHALFGWMFDMDSVQTQDELRRQVPDLMQDRVLHWFGAEHTPGRTYMCLAFCIAFRLLILVTFGWIPMLANVLAATILFWSPQLVNSICHMEGFGYRLHETRDRSRNVWWVAILSLGEGWHNNHHAVPKSARHGMAWWEVDVTYISILVLEKLGLAREIVRPQLSVVLQKKQEERRVLEEQIV